VYIILHSAATEWKFIADDTQQKQESSNHQVKTKEKTLNE